MRNCAKELIIGIASLAAGLSIGSDISYQKAFDAGKSHERQILREELQQQETLEKTVGQYLAEQGEFLGKPLPPRIYTKHGVIAGEKETSQNYQMLIK